MLNERLPSVDPSRFSMVPRADIPRSTFVTTHSLKTTIHGGFLFPIHVDEVLPGDVHQGEMTMFARMATLVFPLMDHVCFETFFFFVPCRLLWTNWAKFMGERYSPADSISFTIPYIQSANGGFAVKSIYDYFGLPTVGQVGGGNFVRVNALPLRAYTLIWQEWFRDQNLQNSIFDKTTLGDGPDSNATYSLLRRNKRHDYFTSALPWPLKGGVDVTLPLAGTANILGIAIDSTKTPTSGNPPNSQQSGGSTASGWAGYYSTSVATQTYIRAISSSADADPVITADLASATGATINALRLAFQTQRLLERDARSGTRYTELLRAHFGVMPEDARLQRPEYIGGGRTDLQTSAIPQTSASGLTGGTTKQGDLTAAAVGAGVHRFRYHATEHGYIIGLLHAGADLTYQQGLHRMWTRSSRYDFFWPVFAHLGEQPIRNDEIYVDGSANDALTFGYQERWAEYRHRPSRITGMFRSTTASTIDPWHSAIKFLSLPSLNTAFIQDDPPFVRNVAAGSSADYMQFLIDTVFKIKTTRAMPMFSVPGMVDHF